MDFMFVETTVFTRRVEALGLEDELPELQRILAANPNAGAVDPGTGGLRKVRLASPKRSQGKRGGARVHYLALAHRGTIYLLYVYGKDEADALTHDQKRQLKLVVDAIKRERP
jgi:hypothetical protein